LGFHASQETEKRLLGKINGFRERKVTNVPPARACRSGQFCVTGVIKTVLGFRGTAVELLLPDLLSTVSEQHLPS
jgi:hypothetical protein